MKREILYFIIIIQIAAVSCGTLRFNKVYSYKDEFRENEKAYTRIKVRPDERRTEVGPARVIIEKESGIKGITADLYFVIYRSASSFRVGLSGYLKAGENKYELTLRDPVSELRTKSEAINSGITNVDSSGVVMGQAADLDTRTWVEEKFVIRLSQEMAAAIVESPEAAFRFYFGPIPVTYVIKGNKLSAIKKVLNQ